VKVAQGFEYIVIINLDAKTSEQALDKICDRLLEKGFIRDSFREAVKERERIYPTGIKTMNCGVAIPHVEPQHVIKNGICIVTLKYPLAFGEMGGDENDMVSVECLFVYLLKALDENKKIIANAMNILQNVEDLNSIRVSASENEICEVISKYAEPKNTTAKEYVV
jgi:PTS system galactitol-specific IIA component